MALDRLLLATHNPGKIKELGQALQGKGIKVLSMQEYDLPEPEETGLTFEANAALKAEAAREATGIPALADDTGLVVPLIGGAPGIYSARWAVGMDGKKDMNRAFERLKSELQAKLGHFPEPGEVEAYFISVLALAEPGKATQYFEGRIDGHLYFPPRGENGLGYDPIFVPERDSRTFGEMTQAEKGQISHRSRAFNKFLAALKTL